MPTVCVYAISKNEIKHVARFMAACKDADGIFVSDTGSTDGTVEALKAAGAIVNEIQVTPWRFDYARNASLQFIPKDFDWCICLDLDEVLTPGWRAKLETFVVANPTVNRLHYHYVWGWKKLPQYRINSSGALVKDSDGVPDVEFTHDKHFHKLGTHNWYLPCHERLTFVGQDCQEVYGTCDIGVDHLADPTKSRASYLPLLEMGLREYPNDDRNAHYLGREYYYHSMWDEAIETLKHHLSLDSKWLPERAASMRFIADSFAKKGDKKQQFRYLMAACGESPESREPWVALAEYYHSLDDHLGCYYAAKKALEIKAKPNTYINNSVAWSEKPYDLAGVHAFYVGLQKESQELCRQALSMNRQDARLQTNMRLVNAALTNSPASVDDTLPQVIEGLTDIEQILRLAKSLNHAERMRQAIQVAKRGISVLGNGTADLSNASTRRSLGAIYDVAANAAWKISEKKNAIEFASRAWELDTSNIQRRCVAEIYWRTGGMPLPRPSAADIPRLSVDGLSGLEERDGSFETIKDQIDRTRRVIVLYPTVRPEQALTVIEHWLKTANNRERIELKVVVKTEEQRALIARHYDGVSICQEPGPARAVNFALQGLQRDDNPVLITALDDLFSPPGWDNWLTAVLNDWDGALLVNYNCPAALVGVIACSYGCLLKMNRILNHPSYYAQYADTELFENLYEAGLLRNYRGPKNPVFEHRHWLMSQRTQDATDVAMLQNGHRDQYNFYRRMAMPLNERLKLEVTA